jgi:hypothetical protein
MVVLPKDRQMRQIKARSQSNRPGVEFLADSTEYVTNHPQKINWKKVKATVRTFARSNKATLKKACQG